MLSDKLKQRVKNAVKTGSYNFDIGEINDLKTEYRNQFHDSFDHLCGTCFASAMRRLIEVL